MKKKPFFLRQSIWQGSKVMKKILALLCLVMSLSGCVTGNKDSNPNTQYTFMDDLNNEVSLAYQPKRVVSLLGSYSETWIESGGTLVGSTEDAVSERNLKLEEDVQIVGTVKEPNLEEIIATNPDFVILSADIATQVKMHDSLQTLKIPHAYFHVEEFEHYLKMLKICTDLTGRDDLYQSNGVAIQSKITKIKDSIPQRNTPYTALYIRAFSTGAKAKGDDNMTGMMLKEMGVVNIVAAHESLLEEISMEAIIQEDPDFIFVTTMGSDAKKALDQLQLTLLSNPAWSSLKAVKNDHYIVLPKEYFHFKPNNKWGDSYEQLAKILYPETFK